MTGIFISAKALAQMMRTLPFKTPLIVSKAMTNKIEISRELAELICTIYPLNAVKHEEVFPAIQELRELLAAPAVERQPDPVCIYWNVKTQDCMDTSPPAPVAVVLPAEDDSQTDYGSYTEGRKHGWNACLDKVKELIQ